MGTVLQDDLEGCVLTPSAPTAHLGTSGWSVFQRNSLKVTQT